MKKKTLFFIFLIAIILLLSGCGGDKDEGTEKCKKKSDCKSKNSKFFKIGCEDGECQYSPVPGKCGNEKCEEDQNEPCTCKVDCYNKDKKKNKFCGGDADDYLEYKCDSKDECVTSVKDKKQESKTDVIDIQERRQTKAKIIAKYDYDTPFNLQGSTLGIELKLDEKAKDIEKVALATIKVIKHTGKKRGDQWQNDEPLIFAEKRSIDRFLWDAEYPVVQDIILKAETNESKKERLTVHLEFEYETLEKGKLVKKEYQHFTEIDIIPVSPSEKPKCNIRECDDGNPCTEDKCITGTGFCDHVITAGSCKGNYRCDSGENKCNAPEDCGSCSGKAGEFTEYVCKQNDCVIEFIESAKVEQVAKSGEIGIPSKNNADIQFKMLKTYNNPFKIAADVLTINFEVLNKKEGTSNFQISSIELGESDGSFLGSVSGLTYKFNKIGDTQPYSVPVTYKMVDPEENKKPILKIFYTYTGQDRKGNPETYTNKVYQENLDGVLFINAK